MGLWLVISIFTLYRHILPLAGGAVSWAFFALVLLQIPTLLSYAEMRSWLGYTGGSYRLVRAVERPRFTFFTGWAYLLGWAALSALLALSIVDDASTLLQAYGIALLDSWLIAIGILVLFGLVSLLGLRPRWRIAIWIMAALVAGVIFLIVALLVLRSGGVQSVGRVSTGTNFIRAVVILIAAMWASELGTEIGSRQTRNFRTTILLWFSGALLGGILAALIPSFISGDKTLPELVGQLILYGNEITLGASLIAAVMAWQVLNLLMLRRIQIIGSDGWLPAWLLESYTRFNSPALLIIIQGAIAILLVVLSVVLTELMDNAPNPFVSLAGLAALAYLILQINVNSAAMLMARKPRADERSLKLPLYPIIPAVGAAISFLLILAIPLPVTLLGIIWFAVGMLVYWSVGRESMRSTQMGRTVFQDTTRRPDITSEFPVVVAIANPDTAHSLVAFGSAIARRNGGHVSIVQIIEVPDQFPLNSERVQAQRKLDILEELLAYAEGLGVAVEGVTRLARSISQGIIDTVSEEQAHLLVMGWNARTKDAGRQDRLGHILDEIIESAACDVAIVRGDWSRESKKVLVPVSGGPNAPRAAELALSLATDGGQVTLLNIARRSAGAQGQRDGLTLLQGVRSRLSMPELAKPLVVTARSPLSGIMEAAAEHDAILMGASEQGFLDQQWFGTLPLQIAKDSEIPLALVRNYAGLGQHVARRAWHSLADILPTLTAEEQVEVYQSMRKAASPNINYFVLIALSAVIATLGLLLNSPAVIIGAMLVAPLMSPIVASSVGIVFGDIRTLRSPLLATVQGVLLGIFIAILITLAIPDVTATPEILARTRPNLLDLMVALASGMAGAYALGRKEVGEALPGVAIAAALMPPICTIGIGFALGATSLGDLRIAFGALLLFTANLAGIIFAATVVFLLLGMRPPQRPESRRWLRQGILISIISLILVSIPLAIILVRGVQQSQLENDARRIVLTAVESWGDVELVDFSLDYQANDLIVNGTLYADYNLPAEELQVKLGELENRLEEELNSAVELYLFSIEGQFLAPVQNSP